MDHEQTQKQRLPFPFNKDLSQVLRSLARVTRAGRERLANSPVTAAYLAAAMRLVKRHLGPGAERTSADPKGRNSALLLLSFLSQREVVKEVANNDARFPRKGSLATLRCTWKSHSNFIADLLRFGLSAVHYPAFRLHEVETVTEEAISGEDFASAIHRICYWDLLGHLEIPMFRLQLVAAASGEGDEVIQEVVAKRYAESTGQWKIIYDRFLRARGLRSRPEFSLDVCADLLAAVAEGLALRQMVDPNAQVIDHDRKRSLLGTATLALIRGCFEPTATAGGLSLEQAVHEMVRQRPTGTVSPEPYRSDRRHQRKADTMIRTGQTVTGERADLLETLANHRYFLRYTVRDLTDEQAARRTTVSALCLGGLIKHVTLTEQQWIDFILDGPSAMSHWDEESGDEGSGDDGSGYDWAAGFSMLAGETLAGLLDEYEQVSARTDELVATLPDLDVSHPLPEAPWFKPGTRWSARRVLLHVIAETAQHAGHADIIRESLDGAKSMG